MKLFVGKVLYQLKNEPVKVPNAIVYHPFTTNYIHFWLVSEVWNYLILMITFTEGLLYS